MSECPVATLTKLRNTRLLHAQYELLTGSHSREKIAGMDDAYDTRAYTYILESVDLSDPFPSIVSSTRALIENIPLGKVFRFQRAANSRALYFNLRNIVLCYSSIDLNYLQPSEGYESMRLTAHPPQA